MILRPYQSAAVAAVADWARTRPGDHPLVVVPTGGGKTPIMAGLVRETREADPSARVLILAHRKELLEQSIQTAWRLFPATQVGVYAANLGRKDTGHPITVAGIQSLRRDPYVLSQRARPIDRVLVDECHLVSSDEDSGFRKTLEGLHRVNPSVQVVGLTATPYRLGTGMLHEGEGRLFTDIAYEIRIPELLNDGYLCPVRPRATAQRLSTAGVAVRGDYVPSALAAAVDVDATTRAIVSECVAAFADRACWLVFGVSVEHCEHLASAFNAMGIPTAAVHGSLSASDRAGRLAAFRDGSLRCVTSCELLTTGFDHPRIDAIAMARPTKSPGLYYQMVGRGFRIHPEKVDCLVLDFAGNVMAHGPVDTLSERIRTRTRDGDGVAPAKECPSCQALVAAGAAVCACGHEFPPPAPPKLETTASERPLLSIDTPEPLWEDVTDVQFSINEPRDAGKRATLRVDYMRGYQRVVSEWVCFNHEGYARSKAIAWWRDRFPGSDIPRTVAEAWEWMTEAPAMHYTPAQAATVPDGQYTRLAGLRWPSERAAWLSPAMTLPRACWTCRFLDADDTCKMADPLASDATPPDWIRETGCDDWALMADADDFARALGTGEAAKVLRRVAA